MGENFQKPRPLSPQHSKICRYIISSKEIALKKAWLFLANGGSILFLAQQGLAATITISEPQDRKVAISLAGPIVEGDFAAFVTLITRQAGRSLSAIQLNSGGGRIDQAA